MAVGDSLGIPFGLLDSIAMATRRSDFDVTDQVRTTDPISVADEVSRIYNELYQGSSDGALSRPFADASRLYAGAYPGFRPCDTGYHNFQHVLDVTLAMARLMDGFERAGAPEGRLGTDLFRLGIVLALFHDSGYIRRTHDTRGGNGAAYTRTHVSRGARFLEPYLRLIGLERLAGVARPLVHFTGYEIAVADIELRDPLLRRLGQLLGTADIVAQMSDRCYLEKCRDRLYPEFVTGGLAVQAGPDGNRHVLIASAADLVVKTPAFYRVARERLVHDLGSAFRFAEPHFRGQNVYLDELEKNIRHAEAVAQRHDLSLLRRTPPPEGLVIASDGREPEPTGPARAMSRLAA